MDLLFVFAAHLDYIKFLCSVPGIDRHEITNITGMTCSSTYSHPADLNIPSVTVARLKGTRIIKRTVTNVGSEAETYAITSRMSPEIALEVSPPAMTILPGQSRDVTITLTVRSVTGTYSFGEILMKGDRRHKVRIPVVAMGFGS
jgi:Fibronectin type-III domain